MLYHHPVFSFMFQYFAQYVKKLGQKSYPMWTRSSKKWYYASKRVDNRVFKYTVYSTSYRRSSSKSRLYRHCQVTEKHIGTLTVKMWGCELVHVWLSSERVPVTLLPTRLTASLKWQFCHADEVHRWTSADVTLGWVKARFRSGSLYFLISRCCVCYSESIDVCVCECVMGWIQSQTHFMEVIFFKVTQFGLYILKLNVLMSL